MKKILKFIFNGIKILLWPIFFFSFLLFIVKFIDATIADKILDYLKVIIWPFVVVLFILSFKVNISKFIDDICELDIFGAKARRDPFPTQTTPQSDVPSEIKESVEIKKEELEEVTNKTEDLKTQNNNLLSQVASLQTALTFERIYQIIFGSQIKLLEALRSAGSSGVNYEDVAAYYQTIRVKWPNLNTYPLESYLNYLSNSGLITVFFESINKKIKITILGIDFLEYIEKLTYTKEKSS